MTEPLPHSNAWGVPPITSEVELADWLGLTFSQLEWFADLKSLESKVNQERLRHYHYRTLTKRFGKMRVIEAPKERLKEIQRRILAHVLDPIPLHATVHGFRRGRSIKTFAAPHTGQQVVLRVDLEDFFPSIRAARVQAVFRTVGYPTCVAKRLAGLCTNSTPKDIWKEGVFAPTPRQIDHSARLYARTHLPQGAPTSPALANLCAYRLDCRLSSLASSAGATYTRYADDPAFSGGRDFDRVVKRFQLHVCAIVMEEGFSVNHRKTRIMRRGVCQHLAGLVVNEHLNVRRTDYDCLKATLTNCIRHGANSQNRDCYDDFRAHLLGRVSFIEMVNPLRGRRLRELSDQIAW